MFRRSAGKGNFRFSGNFPHHRRFIQDIQHPVARRKGVLQSASQRRQRNGRAKGGKEGDGGDQHPVKAYHSALAEQGGNKQHHKVKSQHHRVGYCRIAAGGAFHPFLVFGQCIGLLVHFFQPFLPLAILQGFRKPPQAVQHKAG